MNPPPSRPDRRKKTGKKRLRHGQARMLASHAGADGYAYRAAWRALVAEFGQPAPHTLLRLEFARCAAAWTTLAAATRRLSEARASRATGKGRRPSVQEIARLEKRAGLADASYQQALEKVRQLAERQRRAERPTSPAELLAALGQDDA